MQSQRTLRHQAMRRFLIIEPARTDHEADMERCAADLEREAVAPTDGQMDLFNNPGESCGIGREGARADAKNPHQPQPVGVVCARLGP